MMRSLAGGYACFLAVVLGSYALIDSNFTSDEDQDSGPPPDPPVVRLQYVPPAGGQPPSQRATCVYTPPLPDANVTWYLDDAAMTSRGDDDNCTSAVTIGVEDLGKRLRCVVSDADTDLRLESEPVVIGPADAPVDVSFTLNHERGITLKATCTSRPAADMTWLLGDRVVRHDDADDAIGRPSDDGDGNLTQILHVKLRPADDGAMLRCVVAGEELAGPLERAERVWFKPFDPLDRIPGEEVVVLPGRDANLSCVTLSMEQKYLPRIDTCSFQLPGRGVTAHFHRSDQPGHVAAGYRFNGGPVELGGCGITLERVTETDNGRVLCRIESDKAVLFRRYMTVVVAHPPGSPVLQVEYDGPVIKATCSVGASRPVATIAWYLGDDVIREDSDDDSAPGPEDGDVSDHAPRDGNRCRSPLVDAAVAQTVAWTLEPEDNGRLLRCVMTHPSVDGPVEDTHEILF